MLEPETILTQWGQVGTGGRFRNTLRKRLRQTGQPERAMSVTAEERSVAFMTLQVQGRTTRAGDAVRYTTVARLREAGFTVTETPNLKNSAHVSVSWPGEWGADVAEKFDSCFDDPVAWESDNE